jgi:hypothetical protein
VLRQAWRERIGRWKVHDTYRRIDWCMVRKCTCVSCG